MPGNLGCWFKYILQRMLTGPKASVTGPRLVYNITMTENNVHVSNHVKMVTVYASSSDALQFANVTTANA